MNSEDSKPDLSNEFYNSGTNSLSSTISFTEEEEKLVLRRVDWKLLPGLTFLYLLSFLDRASVGNAKLFGMLKDIGITDPSDYNTALALYFVAYCAFEVPANIVLKRLNPQIWLPLLTIFWGITAICQGFVVNRTGFFIARFFLGVSEAGLFAGCIFVFSMYYKRNERHWRVAIFFGGAAAAGAIGGVLAWGIGHMTDVGSKPNWAWIFSLEGAFTVLVGASAFFWVPGWPRNAQFLGEREKEILLTRLALDNEDSASEEVFKWSEVLAAFKDHLVLGYAFLFFAFAFPLYSLSLFLPTIIAQLGYTSWEAQLLTIPPYATAFAAILFVAYGSHKTNRRGLWIIISGVIAIIGYIVILTSDSPGARFVGVMIAVAGVYAANALILSWPSENVAGHTKRAVAGAMQITIGDTGAIIGVLVYRPSLSASFFRIPHIIAIGFICFGLLVATYLWVYMGKENEKRVTLTSNGNETGVVEKRTVGGSKVGDHDASFLYQL